jgi:hypothetical protein
MLLPASRSGGCCATVGRLLHSPTTDAARRLAFVPSQSRLASSHFSRHARPVSNPSAADRCPRQTVPECGAHVAPAQPFPVALGPSARRVHQRRPRSHQSGSRSDHGQIRLRFRAAMPHRTQQRGIDPGQPRPRPRVQPIVLLSTFADQAHVARMRHDHFVSQLAPPPTYPRRMHARFQRDLATRHPPEHFLHRLRSRAHSLLQPHAPRFIPHAIPTRTIAQIETDRQLLLGTIPTLLHCYGANLLPCRSPLSLALRARR